MNLDAITKAVSEGVAKQLDGVHKAMQRLASILKGTQDAVRQHDDILRSLDDRVRGVEGRQPEKGEPGKDGRDGKDGADGKSVTMEDVQPVIHRAIKEAVAEIPAPKDGRDGKDGKDGLDGKSVSLEEVAPIIREACLEAVAALPVPKDGRDGQDGRDAEPVDIKVIAQETMRMLLESDQVKPILSLLAAEAVKEYMAENPARDGRDGRDGKDADPISDDQIQRHVAEYLARVPPPKGEKGQDGRGAAGALIDRDGCLIMTMTDGTVERLGVVQGKDGRDGVDFTEVEFDYDGERMLTIKGKHGSVTKRLPIPLYKGYWREGMRCEKGDIVTHGGTAFIALAETKSKPCIEDEANWRIFAKRGRDGSDGKNGIDRVSPVKVGAGSEPDQH